MSVNRLNRSPIFDFIYELQDDVEPDADGLDKFAFDASCSIDAVSLARETREASERFAKRFGARSPAPGPDDGRPFRPFTKRARAGREVTTRPDGGTNITWYNPEGSIRKFRTCDPGDVVPEGELND